MILIMTKNELNERAAELLAKKGETIEYYPPFNFETAKNDDTLIVLDLCADGDFQGFDPENFGKKLVSRGLPKSVKKVLLMVSDIWIKADISSPRDIETFAKNMENELYHAYYNVEVQCLYPTSGSTILVPPSDTNKNWEIYKIPSINYEPPQSLPNGPHSITEIKEKELIATTADIREWFCNGSYPYVSAITRDPHPALALFAIKAAREAAAKAKADQQQLPPPSQKAYVEDLSRLPESERLNTLKTFAQEIESLGIKLSVASTASSPSPTTPAK
jgi:hypothetical protein